MPRFAPVALATLIAATALAQSYAQTPAPFTDPANLRGERVSARTGRELPIDQGAPGLEQLLRRLSTRASILNIVAHPDDEDGGMLTFYSRGLGARVADLSLTRGEGGQNAATGDFEDALGLLRTQELLSSDRYPGIGQFFGTEVDFGFSKTKEEAFSKWTHDRVLYDVVRAIRLYRPLVLTATFIGGVTDGHGQHQVSGEIAQEAFVAAADPNLFPDQIREGLLPWQPLKVFARVPRQAITNKGLFDYATGQYTPARFTNYVTGQVTTSAPSPDVAVHEGNADPLLTTCGANPSDLPAHAPAAGESGHAVPDTGHQPSSSPRRPANLSSRSEADGSTSTSSTTHDCRPLTYVQFARIGLGLQRSQVGPGVRNAPAGKLDIAYHLYGSRLCDAPISARPLPVNADIPSKAQDPCIPPATATPPNSGGNAQDPTFFTGIDTSVESISSLAPDAPPFLRSGLEALAGEIATATSNLDPGKPSGIGGTLADALNGLDRLIQRLGETPLNATQRENVLHELRIKRVQLNDALALSLGLSIDARVPADDQMAATSLLVTTEIRSTADQKLSVASEQLENAQGVRSGPAPVSPASSGDERLHELTGERPDMRSPNASSALTSTVTRPYFFRDTIEQPIYQLRNPGLRNAPSTPPALIAWAVVDFRGVKVQIGRVVHGGSQPLALVPPLSVALSAHAQVLPLSERSFPLDALVTSAAPQFPSGELDLKAPAGWRVNPPSADFSQNRMEFQIIPSVDAHRSATDLTATARVKGGASYTEGYHGVGYPGLPRTNFFAPARDRIVPVDLKLPQHRRIAYLPGTGDAVPEALISIGLKPTMLSVADLSPAKLAGFDTVVLGVRTYNAHPDLHGAPTQALLDFARNGGNVIVQYQTAEFTAADAPYPLTLGSAEKVVDETAPVVLLTSGSSQPESEANSHAATALLSSPNQLTAADFNGWIEERGHSFLQTWDPRYIAVTETHDPGQTPQRGGLITVPLGRGHWTYVAFALYRQLPEAVPGAYRIFTNLLGLADAP